MNVLVIGGGGREHTLCWKLKQSPKCEHLFAAPGNAGTASCATNLPIGVNDFEGIKKAVIEHAIQLVIVGPEEPLVNGIHDFFLNDPTLAKVGVIGPQKLAATLEGSKSFAKDFMLRHNIPTAAYAEFNAKNIEEGEAFLTNSKPPYVLKADGLAAGKGVLIIEDLEEAKKELRQMLLESKFGAASSKVVIEEFLEGIELSCFVLTDGSSYITLPMAKDYKRIGEGDTGLNTGGMGAISPVPFVTEAFKEKIDTQIIKPTIEGLQKDGLPFKGFLFIGLIKVGEEPKVIEYNVRLGDPETEVVLPRIKNDLLTIFMAVHEEKLNEISLEINPSFAATVVAVSGGYPEAYEKGKTIFGLENQQDKMIFHAGTTQEKGPVRTSGGRVLVITSFAAKHEEAVRKSYETLSKISFDGINYRKDIGFDL
ncbi:MAG: phosphoribosylamine--glycine ligase [Flavobacteriaceae bacterium]|jgi:phosphoribosylamine--glycine ligase|tara:strand:- start:9 stop:1280 length:1272 start_codon:yes stop_codon:yes gene_type:complete